MKPLKIGISGVRGVVGETLTPELVVGFAQAFGSYLGPGRILVCRDTRTSGPMVCAAVTAGLLATGCDVVDLGICPTPSLQLAVRWLGARGGISITAGHNPAAWNALKFVRQDGLYLTAAQAEELLDLYHQGRFDAATWDRIPSRVEQGEAIQHHLDVLRASFDLACVRERRLKVAVDCCNGSCSLLSPRWLAEMGCEVLAINDDPASPFPHSPEPRPEAAVQVRAMVKAGRADVGLVHDADGERLGLVDETGRALSEEMTLALATEIALGERVGPVVTNVSTTMAVDRIAARHGATVIRTPVGQPYISEAILEHGAVIGGEGNGSVAVPRIQASHDSAAATGLLLCHLAATRLRMSELAGSLPQLAMVKDQLSIEPSVIYTALQEFRDSVQDEGAAVDLLDGVKVAFEDGWVHVRASNTESMIRIIVEADTPARATDLADWARDRLRR
ncbi:MAG: phosphoglucosamine mutase [Acidobacteria bacterium]|nr:MAG: phosphoglucosamine mutase [Acidobacteriota bacterium]RPJ77180.1 MAG: phosphoglucosamine mutase [Acidobacteriota bacterium]